MLIIVIALLAANVLITALHISKISKQAAQADLERSAYYQVILSLQVLLVSLSDFVRKLHGTEVRSLEEMRCLLSEIRQEKSWISELTHAINGLRTDITNWRSAEDTEAP